jgi:hypothetical protein
MSVSMIGGASGDPPLIFSVTPGATSGSSENILASLYQSMLGAGTPVDISAGDTAPGSVQEVSSGGTYTVPGPAQYVFNTGGGPTMLMGTSADTLVAGGDTTFEATGTDNVAVFTDGTNDYEGGSSTDGFIAAGTGYDTINVGTGGGNSVFGGGHADISFADTAGAGGGDVAYLGSGTNTVTSGPGADTVVANGGGNVIFGGTGTLTFVAENYATVVTNTVDGASGGTSIFGAANNDVLFYSPSAGTSSDEVFVAGGGNETLDGGASAGGFSYFGSTGVHSVDSIIGGSSGSDYFQTGSGTEDFTLNGAATLFDLTTSTGGNSVITIDNWNTALDTISGDTVGSTFGTLPDGDLSLTLSDGTVVEFIGLTSSTQVHTK